MGPNCQKLKACCDALVEAVIFADFCIDAYRTGKEDICRTKYQSYADDVTLPLACGGF